jgi:nucleoside-diphosphate-sugar epimerase
MKQDYEKIIKHLNLTKLKGSNILITGANGLIGGFLADLFSYLNDTYNFNIKLTLTSLSKTPNRINHLLNRDDVTYMSLDISKDSLTLSHIDFCFYCAGYAQPSKFLSQSMTTLLLNSYGVANTFDSIFKSNPNATCVYLSSSEIYSASNKTTAHSETDAITIDLTNKRNFYILGKVNGETIVNNLRSNGYNAISARVSLCYGPGVLEDDSRVLSELVQKGLSLNNTIDLFDDGSAKRRYLHITDFTVMLLNIALMGTQNVYNICGEEECTIYDLAKIIGTTVNKEIVKGKTNNTVSVSAPNIVWNSLTRYKNEFGKFPLKSIDSGVIEFINWYKTILNAD